MSHGILPVERDGLFEGRDRFGHANLLVVRDAQSAIGQRRAAEVLDGFFHDPAGLVVSALIVGSYGQSLIGLGRVAFERCRGGVRESVRVAGQGVFTCLSTRTSIRISLMTFTMWRALSVSCSGVIALLCSFLDQSASSTNLVPATSKSTSR